MEFSRSCVYGSGLMQGTILAGLAAWAIAAPAQAQDRRLVFVPAPRLGCRDEAWFRGVIARSFGRDPFAEPRADERSSLRVTVEGDGARLVARADEVIAGQAAVAFVEPARRDATVGCDVVLEQLARSMRLALTADAVAARDAPPQPPTGRPPPRDQREGWRPTLGAHGGVQWGVLPSLGPLVALDLVLGWRRFELQLTGCYDLPVFRALDGGGSIVAQRWSLGAGACARFGAFVAGCVTIDGAAVHARAEGFARSEPVVGPHVSAGLRGRLEVPAGSRLGLRWQVDLMASPVGVRVFSAPGGDHAPPSLLWATPAVQLSTALGVIWRGGVM